MKRTDLIRRLEEAGYSLIRTVGSTIGSKLQGHTGRDRPRTIHGRYYERIYEVCAPSSQEHFYSAELNREGPT